MSEDVWVSGVRLTAEQVASLTELFEENDIAEFDIEPDDFGFWVLKAVWDALLATEEHTQ